MSKEIDQRVVEMRFDNAQFESNVKTSMSTLEKLKQSLSNFGSSGKNIDATKNVNLSGLSSAVEGVKEKFSALEIVGVTALVNIANSAINAGKQLVESLAIEPITQGFEEYELKMKSVQTIMNSSGESLETVNGYLEQLNTYADRTIYSFSDMTSSIGKFTNAGVDLDSAVKAIQGISNEAAVSGANAAQASTAMYNFAQALSSGAVKLIDWKSIENANMATVEFKEQLIQTALELGTLRQEGDKYISTTTDMQGKVSDAFNATSRFNDSLSAQWMTSDVLIKTLGKYADETTELGQKAFESATKVRTFTQLMDTLKEAVGSGWAQTFEILVGDFNEATELWTAVSDTVGGFIDGMSKARNELLKGWKELGGRTDVVDALKNTFEGLKSVIVPVKEAFREIFPPITAARLKEISENLKNLTVNFKIGETTASNLKRTFKGLFAVFDIGKQAFSAIFDGLYSLLGLLPGVSDGILGITGNIGDWLVALDEFIKKNGVFKGAVEVAVSILKIFIGSITAVIDAIKDLSDIEVDFTSFTEGFAEQFEGLDNVIGGVKKVLNGFSDFLKSAFQSLSPLANTFKEIIGGLLGSITESIKSSDLSVVDNIINGGVLVTIGLGIHNFFKNISDVTKNTSGLLENIKGIFDGVRESMEAWQQNLKAKTLLTIAAAIAVLTASIFALSTIDSKQLGVALGALTGEFVLLSVFLEKLDGVLATIKPLKLTIVSAGLVGVASAILILSFAMKNLAEVSLGDTVKGIITITVLSNVLAQLADQLSKNTGNMLSASLQMIALAVAIQMLVKPIKELSTLNWEELAKGVLGVATMIGSLTLFGKYADFSGVSVSSMVGLVALAEAINVLGVAAGKFASLSWGEFAKGLSGITIVLAELWAFTKVYSKDSALTMETASSLLVISASITVLASAVEQIGSMNLSEIGKGLLGLFGTLGSVTLAMITMEKTLKSSVDSLPKVAASLLIVGAALKVIASALEDFSAIDGFGWGLAAMAGSLIELVAALKLMNGALPGAAALIVASGALLVLASALKVFSTLGWTGLGVSLLGLAAALGVLYAASIVMTPVIPVLAALGGALTLVGAGIAGIGIGLVNIAAGLVALSTSGVISDFLDTIDLATWSLKLEAFMGLLPIFFEGLANSFITFVKTIGDSFGALTSTWTQILESLISVAVENAPKVAEALFVIIESFLTSLAEHLPNIVQAGMDILKALLTGVKENIGEIVDLAFDIITEFIKAILLKIPELHDAAFDIVIGLIDGLSESVVKNAKRVREAAINLGKALIEAFLELFGIHSPSTLFFEYGGYIVEGLINGIGSLINKVVEKVGEVVSGMISAIKNKYEEFKSKGKDLMDRLKTGIGNKLSEVKNKTTEVVDGAIASVKSKYDEFKTKGQDLMIRLKTGIGDKLSDVKTKTAEVMTGALASISDKYEDFKNNGKETMIRVKNGIDGMLSEVKGKTTELMLNALTAISDKYNDFKNNGQAAITWLKSGIDSMSDAISSAASGIADWALSGIRSRFQDFVDIGSNLMSGLKQGIDSGISWVTGAVSRAAQSMISTMKQDLDENSPSKVFEEIALFADEGLAGGFIDGISTVTDALHDVGKQTIKAASGIVAEVSDIMSTNVDRSAMGVIGNTLSQIRDFTDLNLDYEPTIRPVLDLSDISRNAARLNTLFPLDYSIGLAGQMSAEVNGNNLNVENSITVNNDDVVGAIEELRSDLATMMNAFSRLQVVMDSGRLVGELVDPMNDALGMKAKYDKRGI